MKNSEAKSFSKIAHMTDGELKAEAVKLTKTKRSSGIQIRIRRVMANARGRELPIALMKPTEYDQLQKGVVLKRKEERGQRLAR